ncbi:hypothetical protein ACU8KI_16740 [Rhizobium leguminosarum]
MSSVELAIPGTFDGYLTQWFTTENENSTTLRQKLIGALDKIPELSRLPVKLPLGWYAYRVTTDVALSNHDSPIASPYQYFLLIRVHKSSGTVIVASPSRHLTKSILDIVINRDLRPNLVPIQLLISDLATCLVKRSDTGFRMTSIYGDFIHEGANVKTMILYGDDLGNANFVKDHIGSIVTNQVGMREDSSLREDARMGAGGSLRFYYRDKAGLSSLERCLVFINELNLYVYPSS